MTNTPATRGDKAIRAIRTGINRLFYTYITFMLSMQLFFIGVTWYAKGPDHLNAGTIMMAPKFYIAIAAGFVIRWIIFGFLPLPEDDNKNLNP